MRTSSLAAGLILLVSPALAQPGPPHPSGRDAQTRPHEGGHGHGHGSGGDEQGGGDRHRGGMTHDFSGIDRWVERFEDPDRASWQQPERVVAALRLEPGDVVADVGAGTGYFVPHLAAAVGASGCVLAADVEPDMVAYLRDRADREGFRNVVPVLCSHDDPRLPPRSTDLVLFVNTWHHVSDRVEYARRLRDDLRAGGRLVLVDYGKDPDRPHGPPPEHCLSPEEAIAELEQAGWWLSGRHDFLRWQYVLEFSTTD